MELVAAASRNLTSKIASMPLGKTLDTAESLWRCNKRHMFFLLVLLYVFPEFLGQPRPRATFPSSSRSSHNPQLGSCPGNRPQFHGSPLEPSPRLPPPGLVRFPFADNPGNELPEEPPGESPARHRQGSRPTRPACRLSARLRCRRPTGALIFRAWVSSKLSPGHARP